MRLSSGAWMPGACLSEHPGDDRCDGEEDQRQDQRDDDVSSVRLHCDGDGRMRAGRSEAVASTTTYVVFQDRS